MSRPVGSNVNIPSPLQVFDNHRNSDLNRSQEAQHHSIGQGAYNASPGNHTHTGEDSPLLLSDFTITGSRSTATASVIEQILTALASIGISDATTA